MPISGGTRPARLSDLHGCNIRTVRKVLITGAGGFTGRYLAPKLAAAGYEVHGTVHAGDDGSIEGLAEGHLANLTDYERVAELVAEVGPEKVVHLAAISFVAHGDVNEIYASNVVGTRNLLEALARTVVPPAAVLLASSANVYGNGRGGMLDESVPVNPVNDYAVSKVAAELIAATYKDRLPIIVVRPFNYTGRGQSDQFIVPKIISHVRAGSSEIELGNLDVARDFSDVRGVVEAYARLLETPAAIGETFNVCSGRATSLQELIQLVRQISGHDFAVRTDPKFVRRDEVTALWGSARKLAGMIGPLPMPPLEDTLRWMLKA
jgi:nucleoside-diphosphate-sugar epimerase